MFNLGSVALVGLSGALVLGCGSGGGTGTSSGGPGFPALVSNYNGTATGFGAGLQTHLGVLNP